MQFEWMQALVIVATSVGAAFLALLGLSVLAPRRRAGLAPAESYLEPIVFLFDEQRLVDATTPARALLDGTPAGQSEWARLSVFLAPRFDDLAQSLAQLAQRGRIELTGREGADALRLTAEDVNGLARITLADPAAEGVGMMVDGLSLRAQELELDQLRQTLDHAPCPIWREDAGGDVIWANRAYAQQAGVLDALTWPLPRLFEPQGANAARLRSIPEGLWFDCHSHAFGPEVLHFALPADATVRAETSLREFVQTLTKTFADLPIGLAIFDRQRQLQMFNPALLDLTHLTPQFLSARPTLFAFLDRLREARMMPEPRDYASWRQQMSALEQASAAGYHTETWSLPNGQTYRVTGRPHPDGAVAFLFEDITSEIGLTRRFRAELEMGQEALDLMPDALAVFLPSGELVLSNTAYGALWGVEPETTLGILTLQDSLGQWRAQCEIEGLSTALRNRAAQGGRGEAVEGTAQMHGGQSLRWRVAPMSGGATLVSFAPAMVAAAPREATVP
ncbi:PAS-domain containing protein [Sinirhodobacter sp. WL0062]|uniref:PAS-domain containing protein n=1 Tax=Rhodobacter flavimaris TaxID=2907145 RepID=A0ABS8YW68_9RHOB|nr:PAS-domain containing protein [Sinirhodobacter sp. WL0062]MCE5974082.1 PAS-domain containing protein [Sinirhodobacter sp. WL0062]